MAKSTSKEPYFLLLSLHQQRIRVFDSDYANVVDELGQIVELKRARTLAAVQALQLADNPPKAILVTDATIAQHYESAAYKDILEYVESGGTLIFMGSFASDIEYGDFDMLSHASGLNWRYYTYSGDTFYRNNKADEIYCNDKIRELSRVNDLPECYDGQVLLLKDVGSDEAWYMGKCYDEVEVEGPEGTMLKGMTVPDPNQCAVASAQVGVGRIGYVGDQYCGQGSTAIVLAMVELSST